MRARREDAQPTLHLGGEACGVRLARRRLGIELERGARALVDRRHGAACLEDLLGLELALLACLARKLRLLPAAVLDKELVVRLGIGGGTHGAFLLADVLERGLGRAQINVLAP